MNETIIYARKSSDNDDRQVLSIDSQIDELVRYAARTNLQVSSIFREARSAKEPGRRIFDEMIEFAACNKINSILCWKLDRLARNPIDGARVIWALEKNEFMIDYCVRQISHLQNEQL
ncbi:MAG TPA: recombinase family protein [candidate division Zixibacteria bacterium]|nr:recombinase family protein [candidate division Zixibacteria bacterium]